MAKTKTPCQKRTKLLKRYRESYKQLQHLRAKAATKGDNPRLRERFDRLRQEMNSTRAEFYVSVDAELNESYDAIRDRHSGMDMTLFREGRAWLRKPDFSRHLLDAKGDIIPDAVVLNPNTYPDSEIIQPLEHGRSIVRQDQKYHLLNAEGQPVHPKGYAAMEKVGSLYLVSDYSFVQQYYIINDQGEVVNSREYLSVDEPQEGRSIAETETGTYVYLDEEGQEAWDVEYTQAEDFRNGVALVQLGYDSEEFYVDKNGYTVE